LGIVNWNANQWDTISLPAGYSKAAVDSAVANMKCCTPPPSGSSCCCCGTPIGGGIWAGGNMLTLGRPKATKVLVLLTDGCQNHLWDPTANPPATSCGCTSEKACATNLVCTGDITKWATWVNTNVPGTKTIVVGVGDNTTICPDQLLTAAGGDPTAVYNPTSWSQLNAIVQTISATACTANAVACINCCGLCTCGVCIPAPRCKDTDKCNIGVFDNSTQCCRTDPVPCKPGPCQIASCNAVSGCVLTNITCIASKNNCSQWICNSTTVVCQQVPIQPPPAGCSNVIIPECVNSTDCDAGDPCLVYSCVNTTGNFKCSNKPKVCGVSDKCTTRACKPGFGCFSSTKTCTDANNCTTDSCVPTIGCVFTPIPPCKKPTDTCKESICDKVQGCIEVPFNCTKLGYVPNTVNCTVPACNKTCFNQYVCATAPPTSAETFPQQTIIISAALGTAAIVGIVIGAAVLVAGVGTAAGVAIAGAAGAGGVALVSANPIYAPSGASGTNALFKGQDDS